MRAFFARLGAGPPGSGQTKVKDGKTRPAVIREKARDAQGAGARALAPPVDVSLLPVPGRPSAVSPEPQEPILLQPLPMPDSSLLGSPLDVTGLVAISSAPSSPQTPAALLTGKTALTTALNDASDSGNNRRGPDQAMMETVQSIPESSDSPPPAAAVPTLARTPAEHGPPLAAAGDTDRKVEKLVAFMTPTTPEPVLALTGEPVNPRPRAEDAKGTAMSLPPATPSVPNATSTSARPKPSTAASRARSSSARPADVTSKSPPAHALRVKKGSTPTLAGASSSALQAVTSRSSSNAVPSSTARSLSAQTTATQAARLRRPEMSRPLSAMSDMSAVTGTTGGGGGGSSYLGSHSNWSQLADDDLLMNLSPRERTRQEVLWEIVSSEERYVADLQSLVATFITSLLPPLPVGSPTLDAWTPPLGTISSATSATWSSPGSSSHGGYPVINEAASPSATRNPSAESVDLLPIAARFQQSTFLERHSSARSSNHESGSGSPAFGTHEYDSFAITSHKPFLYDTLHRPHPLGQLKPIEVPFPDAPLPVGSRRAAPAVRSHQSLPPPTRASVRPASSYHPEPQRRLVSADAAWNRPAQKPLPTPPPDPPLPAPPMSAAAVHADVLGLPEELRALLEVLRDGILPGHLALSRALRARHVEQFPLVRSLADVFNAHSYVLREYTTYVLHLSDALGIVDAALTSGATMGSKKSARKIVEDSEVVRLRKVFQELDELAADKGESGLAISLSKPFQRLLKYPLLLQNLLFHTDPSTKEYEATLGMVEDVEVIIRSIEDEKTAVDDRIRTRDAFARIDGLDRERLLVAPAPSRILQEEFPTGADGARLTTPAAARRQLPVKTREKKVSHRLSDILKPTNTPSDLWIVRFSDVSLMCQRIGTTTLPLASTATRSASLPDLHGKAKFATVSGRRAQQQPRNLYKLLRVHQWAASDVQLSPSQGCQDDTTIGRATGPKRRPSTAPDEPVVDEDAELDSDDSFDDAKSRMSFNYQGGDAVEPAPPLPNGRVTAASTRRARAASSLSQAPKAGAGPPTTTDAARRSSGQDKFGSRLRSPEPPAVPASTRVPSRARSAAPNTSVKRASTPAARPAWNSNVTAAPAKPRTSSANHLKAGTAPPSAAKKSPTPSEDIASLYRSSRRAA